MKKAVAKKAPEKFGTEELQKIQRRLKELNYHEVGAIDGAIGKKTEDAVLSFRNRNGLPLTPTIDEKFVKALATAQPKELPEEQSTATITEVAPKVEAVSQAAGAARTSWWSKVTAWIFGVPSLIVTGASVVVDQFDEAVSVISPVKSMFAEVPWQIWLAGFGLVAIVFAILSGKTHSQASSAKERMVDGYQSGQVANDAKQEPPL